MTEPGGPGANSKFQFLIGGRRTSLTKRPKVSDRGLKSAIFVICDLGPESESLGAIRKVRISRRDTCGDISKMALHVPDKVETVAVCVRSAPPLGFGVRSEDGHRALRCNSLTRPFLTRAVQRIYQETLVAPMYALI